MSVLHTGMGVKNKRMTLLAAAAMAVVAPLFAQEPSSQSDSLVRLMNASSVQLIDEYGRKYRKAVDATFLHNGTYLISDTAFWDVDERMIHAFGHVRIIQDETTLTSDRLDYNIDSSLAMFRGSLVQLTDKENNTLRTLDLDYNTRDSIATFFNGGALKDRDGQVIESIDGRYNSSLKVFNFRNDVNMFTDSVFIRTPELEYRTGEGRAVFPVHVDFWKDKYMLSADNGWYRKPDELFFFTDNVHALSEHQESWSDSLFYYRSSGDVTLLGNAHVQDSSRRVAAMAEYIHYTDSLSRVSMRREASVAIETARNNTVDTLYLGADTLVYWTRYKFDISKDENSEARSKYDEMFVDPVAEYREKAAKEAAAAAAAAAEEAAGKVDRGKRGAPTKPSSTSETSAPADSVGLASVDSVATGPVDSSRIGFLVAIRNVRAFRNDIQMKCDSLRYSDLDSIARMFIDPVIWHEQRRQYSADSMFVLLKKNGLDRASLQSSAFVITREDSLLFDQIKATEIMAYFDTTSSESLKRFDALGGASTIFFLRENGALATVNKVESKMLSGLFENGEIERIFYFDSPKNDAYPIVQLPVEDRLLKGFSWQAERKPLSKDDITSLSVLPSQRSEFESRPKASFLHTERFFKGYMESVYRGIAERDSLRAAAKSAQKSSSGAGAPADTTASPVDSIPKADVVESVSDSLSVRDSISVAADSLSVATDSVGVTKKPSPREIRRAERKARREARWERLDKRDAERAAKKEKKRLERKRARTRRLIEAKRRQDAEDAETLRKYIERYTRKKASKENGKDS